VYWGALSTGISEPDRKRPGFLLRAGSEGGISFADPFEGGISFADPEEWVLQRICKTLRLRRFGFLFQVSESKLSSP
jgi:hypothetical protein